MSIDHDTMLLLIGAGIGLVSSLVTSLFQAWLNKRQYYRQKEYEAHAELNKVILPNVSEVQKYSNKSEPSQLPTFKKKYWSGVDLYKLLIKVTKNRSISFILVSTAIIFINLWIYKLLVSMGEPSPLESSVILAIMCFIITNKIIKLTKAK